MINKTNKFLINNNKNLNKKVKIFIFKLKAYKSEKRRKIKKLIMKTNLNI